MGAQPTGLQVEFGDKGLQRLTYQGKVLEDLQRWPHDGFHIWHMKCLDEHGHALAEGPCGWGENNNGRSWNRATQTWTYRFGWGEIQVHYVVRADALDVEVTEINHGGSHMILDGASIFPLALHLSSAQGTEIRGNTEGPEVTSVAVGSERFVVVAPDASKAVYSGFQKGEDGATEMLVSSTWPDALPAGVHAAGRVVKPGESDRFLVSLRFAGLTKPLGQIAEDAYRNWQQRWPMTLRWADRRIIGTVFLASSPEGNKTRAGGYPGNPRRYFNEDGLAVQGQLGRFQMRVLNQAKEIVVNLKRLHAQGAITWDIEGEEYPQDTSYVCAPDQIADIAPEMESVVATGPYAGMKLDDAYFKVMHDEGLRVGVCVRPQHFTRAVDGSAHQEFLPDERVVQELVRKMKFAHERWGATLFYLDSTVRADGSTLPAAVIEEAAAAMPDSLLIPEESSTRMYRASAGYKTFLFHGDLGTDAAIRALYPEAFSVDLINDADPAKLALHRAELVQSVRRGDVLMVHADHWQQNNDVVIGIYQEAKAER